MVPGWYQTSGRAPRGGGNGADGFGRLMVNIELRTSNSELRTLGSRTKPPQEKVEGRMQDAEIPGKATQSHHHATSKPIASQLVATPKLPSCDPHATLMRPSCDPHATLKLHQSHHQARYKPGQSVVKARGAGGEPGAWNARPLFTRGAVSGPSTINSKHHQPLSPTRHHSLDKTGERLCHWAHRCGTSEFWSRPMKKYSVGIVGYGWVATAHVPAGNASPRSPVGGIGAAG